MINIKNRYLIDTNTLISSLLFPDSFPGACLKFCIQHGSLLTSKDCLLEIQTVLYRKKFDKYLKFEERLEFFKRYVEIALLIHPVQMIRACRDPKDDIFLSLAVAGMAKVLITGDNDLKILNPFKGIPIMGAEEFIRCQK